MMNLSYNVARSKSTHSKQFIDSPLTAVKNSGIVNVAKLNRWKDPPYL